MKKDPNRGRMIELVIEGHKSYYDRNDGCNVYEAIADHLLDNGVTTRQVGKWYKETLPTPPNAKNTTMKHYRYVCPFCGRRNGKKREKFCADCGAILR